MNTEADKDRLTSEQDAEQRAREWLVHLESGEADGEDRQRFQQWLALDKRHRQAYQQAQAIWEGAAALESLKALEPMQTHSQVSGFGARLRYWLSLDAMLPQWGMALAVALLVGVMILSLQPQTVVPTTYETSVAEHRRVELPDGSMLTMSPKTRLTVVFDDERRHVQLLRGEVFFDVAKNPRRPFIVESQYTRVKVLGTMFNVNASDFGVAVAVEEGKVQVSGVDIPGRRDSQHKLIAGQQVNVSKSRGLGRVESIEPASAGAWREGVRIYNARPLNEVLADLGRYHSAELVIADPSLGKLPITAVFPTADTEKMLAALESVLPVQVIAVSNNRIEVQAK